MFAIDYDAPPQGTNTAVSPQVHAGHSVTFRQRASKSSEATFFGDSMSNGTQEQMVDGINIADPVNPSVKLRARAPRP